MLEYLHVTPQLKIFVIGNGVAPDILPYIILQKLTKDDNTPHIIENSTTEWSTGMIYILKNCFLQLLIKARRK